MIMDPILEVQGLEVAYHSRTGGALQALAGVSFSLMPGETLGVLGESGSGKSTLAASILKLFPSRSTLATGRVLFEGRNLLQAGADELQKIRGRRISLIFQEPSVALHPTIRAGQQIRQVLIAHGMKRGAALEERTQELMGMVFRDEAKRIARSYPHELSGGQRQRVLIAQAIACGPSVVIADEPTASLDPTTQMEILHVFRTLRKSLGLAVLFITHNPALLAGFTDRVLVLYAGRVVELGTCEAVLTSPGHPYTKALLQAMPPLAAKTNSSRKQKLPAIPGDSMPSSLPDKGCPFEPRCAERMDICKTKKPALVKVGETQTVSCLKYEGEQEGPQQTTI